METSQLAGQPAEIRITGHVTRKETGKTEPYELVMYIQPQQKEQDNGDNPQHRSA